MLAVFASWYQPGYGFSGLISFGDQYGEKLPAELGCYVEPASPGYDGQFYAKLALNPLLEKPVAGGEFDNFGYRARRIALSWTAWLLGMGRSAWIMQAFAVQNIACWMLLALLLAKKFPPSDLGNYLRWSGVLLSSGMIESLRHALTDGPSLLLVAIAISLSEKGRDTWAGAVLAVSGLMRETNLLAIPTILKSRGRGFGDIVKLAARAVLIVAPLAAWLLYLKLKIAHPTDSLGYRNFDFPLFGFARRWRQIFTGFQENYGLPVFLESVLALVAITAQAVFFAVKIQWRNQWWRLGAATVLLMLFLGDSVWFFYPGAAPRVLLPMMLSFNVLVPKGRRWFWLLLIGNISLVFYPVLLFVHAPGEAVLMSGTASMLSTANGGKAGVHFGTEWCSLEKNRMQGEASRWSRGPATVTIHNPHAFAINAGLRFTIFGKMPPHTVRLVLRGNELGRGTVTPERLKVNVPYVRLESGENQLQFLVSDTGSRLQGGNDPPSFCLSNMRIELKEASISLNSSKF
jgi:hypothetical protein